MNRRLQGEAGRPGSGGREGDCKKKQPGTFLKRKGTFSSDLACWRLALPASTAALLPQACEIFSVEEPVASASRTPSSMVPGDFTGDFTRPEKHGARRMAEDGRDLPKWLLEEAAGARLLLRLLLPAKGPASTASSPSACAIVTIFALFFRRPEGLPPCQSGRAVLDPRSTTPSWLKGLCAAGRAVSGLRSCSDPSLVKALEEEKEKGASELEAALPPSRDELEAALPPSREEQLLALLDALDGRLVARLASPP